MKIHLKRTGGFTGIPLTITIDTDQLDSEEKKVLEEMVTSAQFSALPPRIESTSLGADRFFYRITVEELGASHTVEVGESGLPAALQPLIQRITLIGRSRPKS